MSARSSPEYVSLLRRVLATKPQRIRRERDTVTRLHVNGVAFAREKTVSFKDFALQSARPSRPLLRSANAL